MQSRVLAVVDTNQIPMGQGLGRARFVVVESIGRPEKWLYDRKHRKKDTSLKARATAWRRRLKLATDPGCGATKAAQIQSICLHHGLELL